MTPRSPYSPGFGSNKAFRLEILLLEGFHLSELAAVSEFGEALNHLFGAGATAVHYLSHKGIDVISSCGKACVTTHSIEMMKRGDGIFLVSGGGAFDIAPAILAALAQDARRRGREVAVMSEAVTVLAKRGFFGDAPVVVPWDLHPTWNEHGPFNAVTDRIFFLETPIPTCAGRAATFDFLAELIGRRVGPIARLAMAERLKLGEIRSERAFQQFRIQDRYGIENPIVVAAIEIMEREIEDPLSISEIAGTVGISTRQLERLFKRNLNCTPLSFYHRIRMKIARWMLENSGRSIIDIAISCGYPNVSSFGKAFRALYGFPPSRIRRSLMSAPTGQISDGGHT